MSNRLMLQTITAVLGILATCAVLQAQILPKSGEVNNTRPKSYPIHASDLLWKQELEVQQYVKEHPDALQRKSLHKAETYIVGSTRQWYADDLSPANGPRYLVSSTCKAVGKNCYIFVEDAGWIAGRVTQAAVDSIRIYFDSKTPADPNKGIFQTDVDAFGNPPDVDDDPRIVIFILDIKDGYSSSSGGGFAEGYFISTNEMNNELPAYKTSNYTEMFYIDDNPTNLTTADGLNDVLSTLAHEFQHMINWNYKHSSDLTFFNEGCSVLAEVNAGFPIYTQSYYSKEPNHYLLDWRRNDATAVLTDYSRAARFFVYLRDQVGMSFFKPFVDSTLTGTPGFNAALKAINSSLQFPDVIKNWFVANVVNDRTIDPKYGYLYPNLPPEVGRVYFNPNVSLTTDTVKNYAVQYITFKSSSQLKATFTVSNPALLIKAVEIGPASKRIVDVSSGVEFSEPLYGTTYTEIDFVIMNPDPATSYTYTYRSTGVSQALELRYDYTEPTGVYDLSANDTICVTFNAVQGGRLDSVRVALRRIGTIRSGIWNYTGASRPSPLGTPLALNLTATSVLPTPPVPYPVPWPNWVTMDLHTKNISTNSAFAVGFIMDGAYAGTTNNYVMATKAPIGSGPTSFSYESHPSSGSAGWYYFTVNSSGDSIACYLVRAYVSFPATGVKTIVELTPSTFALRQNYPNPFNPSTSIQFDLPSRGFVTLKVYDMIGRGVATLVNGMTEAGSHAVTFDASGLPSGIYLYRMSTDRFVETKKLVLIK